MSRDSNKTGIRHRDPSARMAVIRKAIIDAVAADAPVSVRGVFYRVVSAGVVSKDDKGYNVVQHQLKVMRREGLIAYEDIVDGTRGIHNLDTWDSVSDLLNYYAYDGKPAHYRRPIWEDQGHEVIITTEKDAISGVLQSVTDHWGVGVGVMRGFSSVTFLHELGEYLIDSPIPEFFIYHFGDLDPSGLAIWEQIEDGIRESTDLSDKTIHMEMVAVTPEQIDEYGLLMLPLNKNQLPHTPDFIERFGNEICEVDAIPANDLRDIVVDLIRSHIDDDILAATVAAMKADREQLRRFAKSADRKPKGR